KVLFTDTECLVWSPNFKLPDENQVLLRVPRQHNMYSFNLENIDPSGGLAYLITKDIVDESTKWHRRVLVIKPQNKTLYEVLTGKTPIISYIRPFGCHVTILNTIDHLGKFEEKYDEGFLVGYSLSNKAFRVYNLETKRVEENMHINFLENKPNVAGKGPTWLFDLEYLTDLMNYQPITTENKAKKLQDIYEVSRDGICTSASYNDEGAVADFINSETTVNVSHILTSRIHSIHPTIQILRDPTSAVQTRRKVNKSSEAYAFIEAIMIFFAFASYMGFIVYQMDVKSAFLYGKIHEEVYVSQPPGFIDPKFPNKVYKVVKALYGLQQAPRAWYATLFTFLVKSGYKRGLIDKTLFIKKDKKDIMLVQVYVEDIIFGSIKKSWCDEFENLMKNRFQMISIGELTFFLILQVKQKEDGIFISQDKYVAEILKKFHFLSVKTASTPIETKKPLVKDEAAADVDVTPKTLHLQAVKRIFTYLKGQPKLGLWYPRESAFDLEAYYNSDYAGENLDRKSTTGCC
nr:retrovirus-related Pol polyprotein from transposon TNT 1-94 [Tanacetum cinerariifolium]